MKTSNFFTFLRLVLAPFFFVVFFLPQWLGTGYAVSVYVLIPLFIFMEFTDFLDGYFARKKNEVSDFGKVFDPFADVLANLTVLFSFVLTGYMPAFLFLIVLFREVSITFIRMLASQKGLAIAARKGGKAKTVLYIISGGFSLALESTKRLQLVLPETLFTTLFSIGLVLYSLAVVASVASFIDYYIHFYKVFKEPSKKDKM